MTPAFRKHIARLAEYFRDAVYAREYTVQTIFVDEAATSALTDGDLLASMNIDCAYLQATLRIYRGTFEEWQSKHYHRVAEIICHEFCHLLTEPLRIHGLQSCTPLTEKLFNEMNERQTQRTCNALLSLVPPRIWKPAKS